jgi:hypothetical protein
MHFKIGKSRSQCPHKMHVRSPGGIMLNEYQCGLPRDHDGNHVSPQGCTWNNTTKFMEDIEKGAEKPNRPWIFLPK